MAMPDMRPLGSSITAVIDSAGQAITGRHWRRQLPDRYQPAPPPVSSMSPTARLADYPGERSEAIGVRPGVGYPLTPEAAAIARQRGGFNQRTPMRARLAESDGRGETAASGRRANRRRQGDAAATAAYRRLAARRKHREARRAGLPERLQAHRRRWRGIARAHRAMLRHIDAWLAARHTATPAMLVVRHVLLPAIRRAAVRTRAHALARARLCNRLLRHVAAGRSV